MKGWLIDCIWVHVGSYFSTLKKMHHSKHRVQILGLCSAIKKGVRFLVQFFVWHVTSVYTVSSYECRIKCLHKYTRTQTILHIYLLSLESEKQVLALKCSHFKNMFTYTLFYFKKSSCSGIYNKNNSIIKDISNGISI